MNYAQAVPLPDTPRAKAVLTSNVLPLRSPRAALEVYLTGDKPDSHLFTLLHSPLGIYVTQTEALHDGLRITLDIAPEDFNFTLHMLMATLPEATIGSIRRWNKAKVQ